MKAIAAKGISQNESGRLWRISERAVLSLTPAALMSHRSHQPLSKLPVTDNSITANRESFMRPPALNAAAAAMKEKNLNARSISCRSMTEVTLLRLCVRNVT